MVHSNKATALEPFLGLQASGHVTAAEQGEHAGQLVDGYNVIRCYAAGWAVGTTPCRPPP